MTLEDALKLVDSGATLLFAFVVYAEIKGMRAALATLSTSFARLADDEVGREPTSRTRRGDK